MPIWPGSAPDAQPINGPETMKSTGRNCKEPDARDPGRLRQARWVYINKVPSRPTMTLSYAPSGNGIRQVQSGGGVSGGGYHDGAVECLEGSEDRLDWLTSRGSRVCCCVACKERRQFPKSGPYPNSPVALEDAQRTVGLVRFHAAEWHIDPHKIGVLGFSAGGHMVAAMSTHFEHRLYPAVDAADKSCRRILRWLSTDTSVACG